IDFKKISGSPIAYWVSDRVREIFDNSEPIGAIFEIRQGMATTNNDLFLRLWFELSLEKSEYTANSLESAKESGKKWFPYNKGGDYHKWYGNREYMVNYENDGQTICNYIDSRPGVGSSGRVISREKYFRECLTWTLISSSSTSFRYTPVGSIIGHKGPGI